MRGISVLVLILGLAMVFGCSAPEGEQNVTTVTGNISENATVIGGSGGDEPPEPECSGPVCGSDGLTYESDCSAIDNGITIFSSGKCVDEKPCADSDGGMKPETSGTVTKDDISNDDYCTTGKVLIEYVCEGGDISEKEVTCEYSCEGGKCIQPEAPPQTSGCSGPSAGDVFSAGTITFNGTKYSDTCNDFSTVKEYLCVNGEIKIKTSQCDVDFRCNAGVCVEIESVCSETDGGYDLYARGKTTVARGLYTSYELWDECTDDATLKERYCSDNSTATSEEIWCGSGYKCASGKCIDSDCSEDDDGLDIYNAGTTTYHDKEKDDDCVNDYEVREYYCYGDEIKDKRVHCPEGYICDRDRCLEGYIK